MSDVLALWKTAHIVSGAVIFGTGIGIAFFAWFGYRSAMRTGEIGVLRATLRLTVTADAWFTAPAVAFQAISGMMLSHLLGWPYLSAWSVTVWSLFLLAGACWIPVLFLQVRMRDQAARTGSIADLPAGFHRQFFAWFVLGFPAFLAVLAIFYLMVAKPLALSGF